uniref:Uncharacterized protein n=1 Tax=Arundo donax TaxID=35708 RepID=A0A0A9HPN7_ARUDO
MLLDVSCMRRWNGESEFGFDYEL